MCSDPPPTLTHADAAGTISSSGDGVYLVNDTVTYSCHASYVFYDGAAVSHVTCLSTGEWSSQEPCVGEETRPLKWTFKETRVGLNIFYLGIK